MRYAVAREINNEGEVIETRAGVQMARLRLEREEGSSLAFADNTIAGPVEVLLKFTRAVNTRGEPDLPARATVPANATVLLSRLMPAQAGTA